MSAENNEIIPLPEGHEMIPGFIEAIKGVQKGRKSIEDTERTPEHIKDMLEHISGPARTYLAAYYLELLRENYEGKALVQASWQSVDQILTESLDLKNKFKNATPSAISQAIKDKHPNDLKGVVASRNIVLGITRQQLQDKEITSEKACELTLELLSSTLSENITHLSDGRTVESADLLNEAAIAIQCISALDIAYEPNGSLETTENIKATSYYLLDVLIQRQAIKHNFYIAAMPEGPEQGIAAKALMDAVTMQMEHVSWIAENTNSMIDGVDYFESLGQTIKTYGRAVRTAYTNGAIQKEEYVDAINKLVRMSWNVMCKKYDEKPEVIDGFHTLITRSGTQIIIKSYPAPWNYDQKKLIDDMINRQPEDKYYAVTLYGFFGILGQLGYCDKETMEYLKEIAFPRKEHQTDQSDPKLPSSTA